MSKSESFPDNIKMYITYIKPEVIEKFLTVKKYLKITTNTGVVHFLLNQKYDSIIRKKQTESNGSE